MSDIFDFDMALEACSWHYGTRMTKEGKQKISKTKVKNNLVERVILSQNIETALRRYKITGCTPTMSERVILLAMLYRASCVFFEKGGNVYAQPATPLGGFNMNDDPIAVYVASKNGIINQEVNLFIKGGDESKLVEKTPTGTQAKDGSGVIVWENRTRLPFIYNVVYYSQAIADTLRTIDTARLWIKRPFIPVMEENLVPSFYDMMDKLISNEELIPMSTGITDIQKFNALPIDGSGNGINTAKELIEWYKQQYRESCNMKSNTNADKKGENLLVDEVHFNEEFTNTAGNDIINYMNEQFDFVNEKLGTNLKAELNQTEQVDETPDAKVVEMSMTRGDNNENVQRTDRQ